MLYYYPTIRSDRYLHAAEAEGPSRHCLMERRLSKLLPRCLPAWWILSSAGFYKAWERRIGSNQYGLAGRTAHWVNGTTEAPWLAMETVANRVCHRHVHSSGVEERVSRRCALCIREPQPGYGYTPHRHPCSIANLPGRPEHSERGPAKAGSRPNCLMIFCLF